ncbi:MAG: hypothetical protein AVO33_10915 [delta proteobacterium ML8_F1]|nr:MAG: hypothetical protein AVO33_10915 [delta proteobacterium ML8_F1]
MEFSVYQPLLGKYVSKLCYGTLTIGPLQRNYEVSFGALLMEKAVGMGINFFDTAEIYDNYGFFKALLEKVPREKVVIATKSYAYDAVTARESLDKALREMGTDYIDIFLLHEQESIHTLRGHGEAIEFFQRAKARGQIRGFGISTHHNAALEGALKTPGIDVVMAITNAKGLGIADGTMAQSIPLLKALKARGTLIYGMKPLGGGHLIASYDEAMAYALGLEFIDSVAVGMQSEAEITANVMTARGLAVPEDVRRRIDETERRLLIHDWCTGCGACISRCHQKALRLEKGKAVVDASKCLICGYCAGVCPHMCIKVI